MAVAKDTGAVGLLELAAAISSSLQPMLFSTASVPAPSAGAEAASRLAEADRMAGDSKSAENGVLDALDIAAARAC